MATDDLAALADGRLEGAEDCRGLAFQSDADVDGHALAQEAVVDQGTVAANGPRGFQGLNAARRRRGRQSYRFAHLVVGGAAVALQVAQDGGVQLVEPAAGLRFGRFLRQLAVYAHVLFPSGSCITKFAHIGSRLRRRI